MSSPLDDYCVLLSPFIPSPSFSAPIGDDVYHALNNCIMLGSEPLVAAQSLSTLRVEQNDTRRTLLRRFWRAVFEIACQVPWFDAGQQKLVTIIQHLQSFPPKTPELGNLYWAGLQESAPVIQQLWHTPASGGGNALIFRRWVNLNAFVARLFNENIVDWYHLGVYSVRRAFERRNYHSSRARRCHIIAAAQWMIYSAPNMFLLTQTAMTPRGQVAFENTGFLPLENPAFDGPTIMTVARWIQWKLWFRGSSLTGYDEPFTAYTYMNIADGGVGIELILSQSALFEQNRREF
ncbi:hypothetical protein F4814DRAFT_426552 [Daldinia grandis]|nr:hypothetical protein F4814DRAFT_426552 [Daldinia grandis]